MYRTRNFFLAGLSALALLTGAELATGQEAPAPAALAQTGDAPRSVEKPVLLVVRLPASARLEIEGMTTRQTGEVRHFISPPVAVGYRYVYTIKASWLEHGTPVVKERQVPVQPGQQTVIDMRMPAEPKADFGVDPKPDTARPAMPPVPPLPPGGDKPGAPAVPPVPPFPPGGDKPGAPAVPPVPPFPPGGDKPGAPAVPPVPPLPPGGDKPGAPAVPPVPPFPPGGDKPGAPGSAACPAIPPWRRQARRRPRCRPSRHSPLEATSPAHAAVPPVPPFPPGGDKPGAPAVPPVPPFPPGGDKPARRQRHLSRHSPLEATSRTRSPKPSVRTSTVRSPT